VQPWLRCVIDRNHCGRCDTSRKAGSARIARRGRLVASPGLRWRDTVELEDGSLVIRRLYNRRYEFLDRRTAGAPPSSHSRLRPRTSTVDVSAFIGTPESTSINATGRDTLSASGEKRADNAW